MNKLEAKIIFVETKIGQIIGEDALEQVIRQVNKNSANKVPANQAINAEDGSNADQIKLALKQQASEELLSRSFIFTGIAEDASKSDKDGVEMCTHCHSFTATTHWH